MNEATCVMGQSDTDYECICTTKFTGTTCNGEFTITVFIFFLTSRTDTLPEDDVCRMWQDDQNQPETWYTDLPPCPCVIWQAMWDWRFLFFFGGIGNRCFVDMTGGLTAPTTECCYDQSGALLVGAPNGGGYRLHNPVFLRNKYNEDIITPHQYCCGSGMCEMFYKLRPSDDCSRYRPITFSKTSHS